MLTPTRGTGAEDDPLDGGEKSNSSYVEMMVYRLISGHNSAVYCHCIFPYASGQGCLVLHMYY